MNGMYKQAGPIPVGKGAGVINGLLESAPKYFGTAAKEGEGLLKTHANRMGAVKDTFRAANPEGTNAYDMASFLYHLPGSWFGQGIYGKWGAGEGFKRLGKFLGANGKYNETTGKWSFVKPEQAREGLAGFADRLAEWGEKGIARGERAARGTDAAMDRMAKRYAIRGPKGPDGHRPINWRNVPAHLGIKAMKGMDGIVGGGLVAGGAGMAANGLLGEDSIISKGVDGVNTALMAPFEWANPLGLAMNLGGRAVNGVIDFGKNQAINAAESASRQTADAIAQGIQDQGRLALMYGAMTPEGFAQKLRERANTQITDRFRDIRQQMS